MQPLQADPLDELLVPAALYLAVMRARELDPLYRHLKRYHISQAYLASQLGMSRQHLQQVFKGLVSPRPGFLERACAVLDISVAKMRVSAPATRRRVS